MMDKDAQSVTQADRDAAASFYQDYLARPGEVPVAVPMRMGIIDESPLIQAFARHRLASQPTSAGDAVALKDPLVVHVNMLRGSIAKPSPRAIWHIYQRELLDAMPEEFRPTPAQTAAIGAEARKHVAKIIADFTGFRQWDDMANDRGQLREFIKRGYDVNEPTKDDCLDAASAILATLSQPVAEPQTEMAGGEAGDFYADLYARTCGLVGILRTALKPFASIKADDGDDFGSYPDEVIIRVEATVGDIKQAREAMLDTIMVRVNELTPPQPEGCTVPLRDSIIHGLRSRGWPKIEAEQEADNRIAALQPEKTK